MRWGHLVSENMEKAKMWDIVRERKTLSQYHTE